MSSNSIKCTETVARLTELLDVWEVPVTATMLHDADPDYSTPTIAHALKQMTAAGLLYSEVNVKDNVFYFPTHKRKTDPIQELICKGKLT